MPPIHKPLKNDGPACRVCGCTDHNACIMPPLNAQQIMVACSLVKTSGADAGPLCSACAGTADDLVEAIKRGRKAFMSNPLVGGGLQDERAIVNAALSRYRKRKKEVDAAG